MEEEEEEEEEEVTPHNKFDDILNLFDIYWFQHSILWFPPPPVQLPPSPPPLEPALYEPHTQPPSRLPLPIFEHRRTRSDESISTSKPAPVKLPRLQTIPSGKEPLSDLIFQSNQLHADHETDAIERKRLSMKKRMKRRSMSELELEELKGLMDLGFEFSDTEVESDPRIANIVPALRKRRISEGEVKVSRRPYLSEAWRFRDEGERSKVLRDWSVLANGDERDVKEQLRRWAHVIASTVR